MRSARENGSSPPAENGHAVSTPLPGLALAPARPARSVEIRASVAASANAPPAVDGRAPSLCRTAAWQSLIEESFGHRAAYVAGVRDGRTLGMLPAFLVRVPLRGRRLVSTPYQGFDGGFDTPDPLVRRAMLRSIEDLAAELDVRYVEIRHLGEIAELREGGYVETAPVLIATAPLTSEDENWRRLAASHRRNVRMAARRGIAIEPASRWEEMEDFHRGLTRHYQELGIPFVGRRFFELLWEKLAPGGDARLLLARHGGDVIGGLLLLFSGRTLIVKYGVTRHGGEYAHANASYALYWEAIRCGLAAGCAEVNFGITGADHAGLRDFKRGFGAVEERARFSYRLSRGRIPDYAGYYGAFPLARRVWKGLPGAVARPLGARINRWIC